VTRFRMGNTFANPFRLWPELALKTGEMMLASAEVIGHRTNQMAIAGPKPSSRDRREFTLMGQEKIEAANESAQAIAAQMMRINPLPGWRAFSRTVAVANAMMSVASSRTVAQSLRRQAALARTLAQSGATAPQICKSAAQVAWHGLNPLHSRATANAKRLRKS
jgi:beta-phosphoglucomutase-like phosphatase (HAD superfamily)